MKIFITLVLFLFLGAAIAQETLNDKVFFSNSLMQGNFFYSSASYTSPSWIKNFSQKLPVNDQIFFTPGNSLELNYVSANGGNWKAEILYHPLRGVDFFKTATKLSFWLYITPGTNPNDLPGVAVGNKEKGISNSINLKDYIVDYQFNKWLRVQIPLKMFRTQDLFKADEIDVINYQQQSADGKEHQLYIDQLELLPDELNQQVKITPVILSARGYERHIDLEWAAISDPNIKYVKIYRSIDNRTFYPVNVEVPQFSRHSDFIDSAYGTYYYKISFLDREYRESSLSAALSASTHPMTDEQLLDMVQKACFRYYWEGGEANSGLSPECIPGRRNMIATGASGFGIMALLAGAERKFITRDQLVERFDRITRFLENAEKFHGAFSHFIDGPSGKAEPFFGQNDNGGDLVETAFLMQGMLAAREYFSDSEPREKEIRQRITRLWEGVEWDWYRRYPDGKFLYWHWSPDKTWIINHKLIGWNETMITYILGISSPTHSIPAKMYYTGYASQAEEAQKYRSAWGNTQDGSMFTNGKTYYGIPLAVGVSDGGPLFFTHYSFMGLDPQRMQDAYTNYFTNNKNIALINYRYCLENPGKHSGYGPGGWGLTASDGPWDYSADEPVLTTDNGKISPTGAIASFPYTPEESMQALKNYYRQYGKFLWGTYGFRDAINLDENWCSEIYMGLNQAPMVVMIENYRSKKIWNLFMSNPEIQEGLRKLSSESPK